MKGAGAGAPKGEVVGACPNMSIRLFSFSFNCATLTGLKRKKSHTNKINRKRECTIEWLAVVVMARDLVSGDARHLLFWKM